MKRLDVAVIGAGVAGLGAAWALSRRHRVTLYERERRLGGHSNTVDVPWRDGSIAVDTGFIVYNTDTYPNLIRLLEHLGVETRPSDMSFAVSVDDGRLEYASDSLAALFAQRRNLVNLRHYAMLRDVLRFYRQAPLLLATPDLGTTLGDYLRRERYSPGFVDDHLLPMAAAIWSCSTRQILCFPAVSFVRFFVNHGLLRLADRPQWRTVAGGSREYVRRIARALGSPAWTGLPVAAIRRTDSGVEVIDSSGHRRHHDRVVMASHADQSLSVLADADDGERDVLGAFAYQRNRAYLHRDTALMPRRRTVWSSWNYLGQRDDNGDRSVSVTYWMNRLQGIDPACPLFVSLNPRREPRAEDWIAAFDYDHPLFDARALAAQTRLPTIQGRRRVWFCGSYCGYGFHEDALSSGLAAASALGAPPPWQLMPAAASGSVGALPLEGRMAAAPSADD
jgi:predicted NAD/FAD-binding protein